MWNCGRLESAGRSLEPAVRSHVATPIESTCSLRPAIHMRRPPARQQSLSYLLLTQGWPSQSTSAGLSNAPPRVLDLGASLAGRHQASLSRYQATVATRPSAKPVCSGAQPIIISPRRLNPSRSRVDQTRRTPRHPAAPPRTLA